jgi:NADPH:quinone reductase-like Zn-dependent oxidoreductase
MNGSFPLGLELSGIVRRIGRNVRNVSVGNRVCALAFEGCFSTSAVIESPLVVGIPDELSFEDAAGMPLCFATVIQSLVDVGRLERDQVSHYRPLVFSRSPESPPTSSEFLYRPFSC